MLRASAMSSLKATPSTSTLASATAFPSASNRLAVWSATNPAIESLIWRPARMIEGSYPAFCALKVR